MSVIPSGHTPAAPPAETVEQRFRRLEAVWTAETAYLSSASKIVGHPSFQEIIGMGQVVVPLMLRDLAERPRLWVWALPKITEADPVPTADRGHIAKMTEAWLHYSERHKSSTRSGTFRLELPSQSEHYTAR